MAYNFNICNFQLLWSCKQNLAYESIIEVIDHLVDIRGDPTFYNFAKNSQRRGLMGVRFKGFTAFNNL